MKNPVLTHPRSRHDPRRTLCSCPPRSLPDSRLCFHDSHRSRVWVSRTTTTYNTDTLTPSLVSIVLSHTQSDVQCLWEFYYHRISLQIRRVDVSGLHRTDHPCGVTVSGSEGDRAKHVPRQGFSGVPSATLFVP